MNQLLTNLWGKVLDNKSTVIKVASVVACAAFGLGVGSVLSDFQSEQDLIQDLIDEAGEEE